MQQQAAARLSAIVRSRRHRQNAEMTRRPAQEDATRPIRQELGSRMIDASTAELVSWLAHDEPQARELAAAYLGDRLIHACRTDLETVDMVLPLVDSLTRETDATVQEEIAHSLGYLVEYGTVPNSIVPALSECLPRLHAEAAEQVRNVIGEAG
ncbi:hypothetical protein [Actinomadura parmotrematis]|uniref:HEAT repeat domain-containing protein n=1 Tax=Actinomadura parmotrematis TaxID=2864039 RepID=A0ABS7FQ25_9ACTN|nr:hypothetical protein [Actinomadura parmotrematis]MBW8482070.1 hypothetical protein [Actinomadura parmotrematis]